MRRWVISEPLCSYQEYIWAGFPALELLIIPGDHVMKQVEELAVCLRLYAVVVVHGAGGYCHGDTVGVEVTD